MDPSLAQRAVRFLERVLLRPMPPRAARATTSGLPCGWVGPRLEVWLEPPGPQARLVLRGRHTAVGADTRVLELALWVDGRPLEPLRVAAFGPFEALFELPLGRLTPVRVELTSAPAFVPDTVLGNGDQRALTFELDHLSLERAGE
jgi:hypothetical protein